MTCITLERFPGLSNSETVQRMLTEHPELAANAQFKKGAEEMMVCYEILF